MQQNFSSAKSENIHLNSQIEVYERRQLENEKNLHLVRASNGELKENLKNHVDDIKNQMKIEIIRLEKQRDDKFAENEGISSTATRFRSIFRFITVLELLEKVKNLDQDLLAKRRRLDEMELHLEETKQNLKLTYLHQNEAWLKEK